MCKTESGAVQGQPIGYASYVYDNETSLYYLQARYYNPFTGNFLSLDPDSGDLDDPLSQNGYSYVNGNPVNMIDSEGKYAQIVTGAAIGMAISIVAYLAEKIAKYGFEKAWRYIDVKKLAKEMGKGAFAGAISSIGLGAASYLAKEAALSSITSKILTLHFVPPVYLLSGGGLSAKGFLESLITHKLSDRNSALYNTLKSYFKGKNKKR